MKTRPWALAAHLLVFLAGVIGPLVIWLIYKDKSRFVAYHAIQAMIFQAVAAAVVLVVALLTCGIGAVLAPVVFIPEIIYGIKAYNGEWAGYPLIDEVGR